MAFSRRDFLGTAVLTTAALAAGPADQAQDPQQEAKSSKGKVPILISSSNGMNGLDGGYELLRRGGDTLEAAIFVGKVQEDDPNDTSVGLGGLPNEEGEVELDSCCVHGPTRRMGSVGG